MAMQKEQAKIPLCEYDPSQESVLMPNHEKLGITLPPVAVFAFLEDLIDEYAKQNHLPVLAQFVSATKTYPVYGLNLDGKAICLCQAPVGAPAAVQIMDWLIAYGVKHVISAGSCGALVDLPENCFLVPAKALRDEGTSYHYLPPERFVETDEETRRIIERCFRKKGLAYEECVTWTTDGFFRETKDKVLARRQEGCTVVEMECAALAACALFPDSLPRKPLSCPDRDLQKYHLLHGDQAAASGKRGALPAGVRAEQQHALGGGAFLQDLPYL